MFKVPLFLAMLCVGDIAHVGAEYMCGTELEPYDSKTQTCVDGKVVDNTMICGNPVHNIPIQSIKIRTHDCVDGMEVPKVKAQTQATPLPPGPPETTKPTSPPQTTKSSPAANLDRRHSTEMCHSDKVADGYACCVNKVYRPGEETCCIITNSYYEVLPGPEIDHICCTDPDKMTSTVHRRGSPNIPCQHPSSNDQLFGRGQKLEALKKCDTFKHVFIIRIKNQKITKSSTTIDIYIRGWTRRRKQNNTVRHSTSKWSRTNQVKAQLDKFIPVNGKLILRDDRVIKKKCFLLFTNKNYYEDAVFFLDQNEVLYECPKKRQSKRQSKKQSKRQSKKQSKRQSKRQSKKQSKRQSKRQSKKQSKRQSKRQPIKQLVQEYIKNCN